MTYVCDINSQRELREFNEKETIEEKFEYLKIPWDPTKYIEVHKAPPQGWGTPPEGLHAPFEIAQYFDGCGTFGSRFKRKVHLKDRPNKETK